MVQAVLLNYRDIFGTSIFLIYLRSAVAFSKKVFNFTATKR